MSGMLGSRGADNTLSGLVEMVSDPAKFKKSMADLKAATTKHRAERDAAAKKKAEAENTLNEVNTRLGFLASVEAKVNEDQKKLNDSINTLNTKQAAYDAGVRSFNDAMDKTLKDHNDRIKAERKAIAVEKAEFDQRIKDHAAGLDKANAAVKARQAELDAVGVRNTQRLAALNAREADVAKLEVDVRARIAKVNELFPIR